MARRAWWFLAGLPIACFSEESSTGSGNDAAETSAASTGMTTDVTTADTSATDDPSTSTTDSTTASTTADTSTGVTTGPDELCNWPLDWPSTLVKDVVVLAKSEPSNLSVVVSNAETAATTAGFHIAVASGCSLNCGVDGDGYEHHLLPAGGDPLQQAASLILSDGFFRQLAPRHVVIITDVDTMWSEDMFVSEPMFAGAQVHVRAPHAASCNNTPNLDAFALLSQGSSTCGDFVGPEIFAGAVLQPQPACELFGDVGEGPGDELGRSLMFLDGMIGEDPAMLMPDGPGLCGNAPEAWSLAELGTGHLRLCPALCRDVGGWAPDGRTASLQFPC